ncbi:type II toxin-antitoxin system RelE/ParE family toxin [Oceaniradius stylonematis]|jgi:phage-related protein|uniref:Type II toxin-antitoxin system RelE/ParE family toxin n=2 Tax=Oceaniradius stylonematis TaxID=2184161 RepID=A0A3A8ADK2_9HYPH|nr:type II toxin-antitoxin system RelE/ParE family toxin [Oceaniradius stylonematis]RNC96793.1 MAG: type II toxin-antitoxin system RelE/ParE family toxin [Oricola sp.]
MVWTVETLDQRVDDELGALPNDMRAKFVWIAELIEAKGLPNVREPYVKPLERGLWEIRMKGRDGIARAIYVTARSERVIVVRVFRKKSQRTPRSEIRLALERAAEAK